MGRWMGGVQVGCTPPLLKDSERGGREGSEMRLDTLCWSAGELCLFILERSSTWDRSHTTQSLTARFTPRHSTMHPYKPQDSPRLFVGRCCSGIVPFHVLIFLGVTPRGPARKSCFSLAQELVSPVEPLPNFSKATSSENIKSKLTFSRCQRGRCQFYHHPFNHMHLFFCPGRGVSDGFRKKKVTDLL